MRTARLLRPLLLSVVLPPLLAMPAFSRPEPPERPRGFLGITLEPVSDAVRSALAMEEGRGVLVGTVVEGSAAEEAGMASGDVILSMDRRPVRGPRELIRTVAAHAPGDRLDLEVWRQGRVLRLGVHLMRRPEGRPGGSEPPRKTRAADGDRLGITAVGLTDQLADYFVAPGGVLITSISPGSAAEVAGLLAGDVIVAVGDSEILAPAQLQQLLGSHDAATVLLAIVRQGNDIFVEAALE